MFIPLPPRTYPYHVHPPPPHTHTYPLQERFTQDMQPHYVYSPREMTRWVRGIYEALKPVETLPVEGLVRIWAHEALRLFQDRLIYDEERAWTDENINMVANKHFPSVDNKVCVYEGVVGECA